MSVTLAREHSPADFSEILSDLEQHPMQMNNDRHIAGKGRSQAFGIIRRWSYRPWLSRNTWGRPKLWALLLDFAEKFVQIDFDAVQVNDNYQSAPHRDKGNCGVSYIVGFGPYQQGELLVDVSGSTNRYDIRHRGHLFNGSQLLHSTGSWTGSRYCLVFYKIEWPAKWPRYILSCKLVEDGLEVSDEYNDSVMVISRGGKVVRVVRQGKPMPWIGKLTARGQKSRDETYSEELVLSEGAFA